MTGLNYRPRLALVLSTLMLFSGCLLKPAAVSTRELVLAPIPPPEHPPAVQDRLSVGVAFVKMPPYLLKDDVALRKGTNEIEYLQNTLWAERLDRSFQEVLAANLSTLLPSNRVYSTGWERDQVLMTLVVNVEQFDVNTQGQGTLIAEWRITGPDGDKILQSGQAHFVHTGGSPRDNPQLIAATLSDLTADLSRQLAEAIRDHSAQALR